MSDLISRKALLEIFNHDLACFETGSKTEKEIYISVADMRKMIEEQPTAYNVEKVVEKLEEMQMQAQKDMQLSDTYAKANAYGGMMIAYGVALSAVRNSGNADVAETNVGNNG